VRREASPTTVLDFAAPVVEDADLALESRATLVRYQPAQPA